MIINAHRNEIINILHFKKWWIFDFDEYLNEKKNVKHIYIYGKQ